MTPRVLALRALGLGDLLAGVPALRGLRRALPGHRVLLAAPEALRPLVELSGAVDELLPTGELEPVAWTGPPPEVAVDLHGNGPASRRLLEVLHPSRLVAFAVPSGAGTQLAGPVWDPEEHEVRRWCRLVDDAFGGHADPDDLLLRPPGRAPFVAGAAVVHPGAASVSRRWPVERYAAVARHLAGRDVPVVVTGSPDEEPLVGRVLALAGLPPSAAAGRTDLVDLAALVASARVVVCGDTGVAHLASAYRTPSVVLFGPTPPHRWGPPAAGPHHALWHGSRVGDPHGTEPDPALLLIGVPEVLTHVERALSGMPAAR